MAAAVNTFEYLARDFDHLYSNAHTYLESPQSLHSNLINSSKRLHDLIRELDDDLNRNSLKQLLTTGFDNEQIWQQLQLQNRPILRKFHNCRKEILDRSFSLIPKNCQENDQSDGEDEEFVEEDEEKEEEEEEDDKTSSILSNDDELHDDDHEFHDLDSEDFSNDCKNQSPLKKYKQTIVDDTFFKLREMEEFLDEQDRREQLQENGDLMDVENENFDFFKEELTDDCADIMNIKYADFFDAPDLAVHQKKEKKNVTNKTPNRVEELEDKDESASVAIDGGDAENNEKSIHEKQQEEMTKKIKRLEEANISDKPWQLKGETTSKQRPVNSLLEDYVTFDHTSVGAPVITEETTETLEDLIKQRIKDKAWDDVERKVKPRTQPYEYKKAPELNMEKSKLSLAEVYEKEYLKQAHVDKEEKENEDHVSIKKLMNKLFCKLDALSNFYFTPKPPKPELKIVTNAPSIQMEEVTPITMTTASQLAPEEIYDKKRGDTKGDGEKAVEDRKRERRQKKLKKKFAVKEKARKEDLMAKSGKISKTSAKKKALDQLKKGTRNTIVNENNTAASKVKSSNQFFTRLQDEVKNSINKTKNVENQHGTKATTKTHFLKL